ncbi:hypothetical protein Tco_0737757 [Tanacetum coccineum]
MSFTAWHALLCAIALQGFIHYLDIRDLHEKTRMLECNVEVLNKCLEQQEGDSSKCKSQIEAFSASIKKP